MPELTINLNAVKMFVADIATELTLDECEQVKKELKTTSPFPVNIYQGGNPDYRIIEVAFYNRTDEEAVCEVLKSYSLNGTVGIELIFN